MTHRFPLRFLFLAAWIALLAGCSRQTEANRPAVEPAITNYDVRGFVREVPTNGRTIVIQHQEIPGYMPAMTMPFTVRQPRDLEGIKTGDEVSFRMRVTADDGWIDQIRVLSNVPASSSSAGVPPPAVVLPNAWELSVGDALPDYTLTNQLGQTISLSALRGKALAITFIFTRCPFPTFCLRMTERFKSLQAALETSGSPTNWHLLSVSFDPAFDTPETLRRYGEGHGYHPDHWSLVTGSLDQVDRLAGGFGLYFSRTDNPIQQNHNLRTVVIGRDQRVRKILVGNEWKTEELVEELRRAAAE